MMASLAALCGRPPKWQSPFARLERMSRASEESDQSRPKPFGNSTAWISST